AAAPKQRGGVPRDCLRQPRLRRGGAALPCLQRGRAMPRVALERRARRLPAFLSERRVHRAHEALGGAVGALSISVSLLLLFAALVAALPFIYATWRRIDAREADLQIWRVMARRGIVAEDAPAAQAKLARAVRRCVLCPGIGEG